MNETTQLVLAIFGAALTAAGLSWTIFQSHIIALKELINVNLGSVRSRLEVMDKARDETRGELHTTFQQFLDLGDKLTERYESLQKRLDRIEHDLEHRCFDCPTMKTGARHAKRTPPRNDDA